MNSIKINRIKPILSSLLLAAGISFIVSILITHWGEVSLALDKLSMPTLIISVLLGIASNFGFALMYHKLLFKHQIELPQSSAVSIFYFSQITKYIPGKIWSYIFQFSKIKESGSSFNIVSVNIELMILSIIITATLSLTIIIYELNIYLSAALLAFGVLTSFLLQKVNLLKIIPVKLREKVETRPTLNNSLTFFRNTLFLCWLSLLIYVVASVIFICSISNIEPHEAVELTSILMVSSIVGILVFITPAGLGIKEGVFILLASSLATYDSGLLATIAVLTRFWQILVDLIGGLLALTFSRVASD